MCNSEATYWITCEKQGPSHSDEQSTWWGLMSFLGSPWACSPGCQKWTVAGEVPLHVQVIRLGEGWECRHAFGHWVVFQLNLIWRLLCFSVSPSLDFLSSLCNCCQALYCGCWDISVVSLYLIWVQQGLSAEHLKMEGPELAVSGSHPTRHLCSCSYPVFPEAQQ